MKGVQTTHRQRWERQQAFPGVRPAEPTVADFEAIIYQQKWTRDGSAFTDLLVLANSKAQAEQMGLLRLESIGYTDLTLTENTPREWMVETAKNVLENETIEEWSLRNGHAD